MTLKTCYNNYTPVSSQPLLSVRISNMYCIKICVMFSITLLHFRARQMFLYKGISDTIELLVREYSKSYKAILYANLNFATKKKWFSQIQLRYNYCTLFCLLFRRHTLYYWGKRTSLRDGSSFECLPSWWRYSPIVEVCARGTENTKWTQCVVEGMRFPVHPWRSYGDSVHFCAVF